MKYSKIIYWVPMVLSIIFVLFLSMLAFDVFGEYSGWMVVLAFLIHMIPSFVLLALVILAWKYDLVGAIAFFGFAVWYVAMMGFGYYWTMYAGIAGPAIVVGAFFLLSWFQKRAQLKNQNTT